MLHFLCTWKELLHYSSPSFCPFPSLSASSSSLIIIIIQSKGLLETVEHEDSKFTLKNKGTKKEWVRVHI